MDNSFNIKISHLLIFIDYKFISYIFFPKPKVHKLAYLHFKEGFNQRNNYGHVRKHGEEKSLFQQGCIPSLIFSIDFKNIKDQ